MSCDRTATHSSHSNCFDLLMRINERQKKKPSHKSAARLDSCNGPPSHYIKRRTVNEMKQLRQQQMIDPAWQREFKKTIASNSLKARTLIPTRTFLTTLSETFPSFLCKYERLCSLVIYIAMQFYEAILTSHCLP